MEHLLRDSHQLAFELQGQRLDPDDRMMRVDIKDFFMSGDAESLVVDACSIIPGGDLRAVAERVAFFLLRNQLIRSDLLPNRCWRVIKGSGMGLKHSSALCDAALFAKCERPFILNKAAAQFFGIKYYRRFKDDMFAIVSNPGKAGAWLHCVRKRCKGTFLFTCESCSRVAVTMLALKVLRGPLGTVLTEPRPLTLDGPILSITSAHHSSVHRGWPSALLRNQLGMTSVELRYSVAQRAIERFAKHFASEAVIHGLRCEAQRWQSNNWVSRHTVAKGVTSNSGGDSKIVWLVLPGHPALRGFREIERALRNLQMDSLWSSAWRSAWQGPAPAIRISWKSCLPHAVSIFQSIGGRIFRPT